MWCPPDEIVLKNYGKAKAQAARAEKKEKKRLAEKQRRNNVKQDVKRSVEPGTVTCEIRPAHWCNICYRAFHSNKDMIHHARTAMHKRGLKQLSAEALGNVLHVSPNLGQPYTEGTAQFGYAEGGGFYCYLCQVGVGDGLGLDAHLIDKQHLDKLAEAAPVKPAPKGAAPEEAAPEGGNAGGSGAGGNAGNESAGENAGNAGGNVGNESEIGVAT